MSIIQLSYGGELLAGVDEVGRGPLAGDVVTAAVILDPKNPVAGLADSKKLSASRRSQLAAEISKKALSWCIARASVAEIDEYNILRATMMAMVRAVDGLTLKPEHVAVDGNRIPDWGYVAESVVGGDDKIPAISAASILAKVCRDAEMCQAEQLFPGYGFASHKGYGTSAHREAIALLGPCKIHRKSFEPVKSILAARHHALT